MSGVPEENLNGPDRIPESNPPGQKLPGYDADAHLRHLLPPTDMEKPWFLSIVQNIKDMINPPKLPPLEINSNPVPIN